MTRLPILGPDRCEAIRTRIYELKEHWRKRSEAVPFFTLGTASYLDARSSSDAYKFQNQSDSPLLMHHFEDLYKQVGATLQEHLGQSVTHRHEQAPPGFHIYLAHPFFEKPVADVHFDRQYSWLNWPNQHEIDLSTHLSFTLPISIPRLGAGLHVWDIESSSFTTKSREQQKVIFREACKVYEPYEIGTLFLHSGDLLHQIAPGTRLSQDDERITLQGHALRRRNTWLLYW